MPSSESVRSRPRLAVIPQVDHEDSAIVFESAAGSFHVFTWDQFCRLSQEQRKQCGRSKMGSHFILFVPSG